MKINYSIKYNIMKLCKLILLLTLFSCNKEETEIKSSFEVNVIGDIKTHFSNLPESRNITIRTSQLFIKNGEKVENKLVDAEKISVRIEGGDFFNISETNCIGNDFNLSLNCTENKTDDIRSSMLVIEIDTGDKKTEKKFKLNQGKAEIKVTYFITCEEKSPFILPDNGGSFEIPFKCFKISTINNSETRTTPSNLKELRYEIYCINSGWIHSTEIVKNGTEEGSYLFKITANGYYNMEFESEWYVRILTLHNTEIYKIEFIHKQTPGEDFYTPTKTNINRGTFDI